MEREMGEGRGERKRGREREILRIREGGKEYVLEKTMNSSHLRRT